MHVTSERAPYRRQEDPHEVMSTVAVKADHIAPAYNNGFTYEQAYRTEFRATTMWYANEAQFQYRRDLAHKEMLYYIYGPVIAKLDTIRARSADRDWKAVHEIINELEKELTA
jgi:hypothetical protein